MEMGDQGVVDPGFTSPGQASLNVSGDPLCRLAAVIRFMVHHHQLKPLQMVSHAVITRIDEKGGPVGKDEKGCIPPSCVDVVDVEIPLTPLRQQVACPGCGCIGLWITCPRCACIGLWIASLSCGCCG